MNSSENPRPRKRVGFTGSRHGLTESQKETIARIAEKTEWWLHEDCVGSDAESHGIVVQAGCRIHLFPPENRQARAWCKESNEVEPERPYLIRNRAIVDACEILVAAPNGFKEEKRYSGTWATIRYAMKVRRPVLIIFPDGSIERRSFL